MPEATSQVPLKQSVLSQRDLAPLFTLLPQAQRHRGRGAGQWHRALHRQVDHRPVWRRHSRQQRVQRLDPLRGGPAHLGGNAPTGGVKAPPLACASRLIAHTIHRVQFHPHARFTWILSLLRLGLTRFCLSVPAWFVDPLVWNQIVAWLLQFLGTALDWCMCSDTARPGSKRGVLGSPKCWLLKNVASVHYGGLSLHPPPSLQLAVDPGQGHLLQTALLVQLVIGNRRLRLPVAHRPRRRG